MISPGVILATLSLFVVAVPFGLLLLLVEGGWAPVWRIDVAARDVLHGFALDHGGFVSLMRALSWMGSTGVWFVVFAVVALMLLRGRHVRLAVFSVVTVVGSSLLNSTVKAVVGRTRPVLADPLAQAGGWSFPSGHAQAAVVGYAVLVLLFLVVSPLTRTGRWRWLVVAVASVMVLAIGFSRIALGVHYVSDVLGGYFLGTAWLLAMIAALGVLSPGRPGRWGGRR